jgi:hypothetical protein
MKLFYNDLSTVNGSSASAKWMVLAEMDGMKQ